MKKFFVRKILKYDPSFRGKHSLYEGYRLISLKKKDPGIMGGLVNIPAVRIEKIYHSALKRGFETAQVASEQLGVKNIKPLIELVEIKFDLKKLLNQEEFNRLGSHIVRKRFIEAFINDTLEEDRNKIKKRIYVLLRRMEELKDGNYLLISHSFFMKILQIYLKNKKLFDNPEILRKHFNYKKKTFKFGSGFDFGL